MHDPFKQEFVLEGVRTVHNEYVYVSAKTRPRLRTFARHLLFQVVE